MENKNTYDHLLDLFCTDEDCYVDIYKTPIECKDFVIATDLFMTIEVPLDLPLLRYKKATEEFTRSFNRVISYVELIEPENDTVVKASDITAVLESHPTVPFYETLLETVTCSACHGFGEVDFEFDHEYQTYKTESQCPVCNGEGNEVKSTAIRTDTVVPDEAVLIWFGNALIKPSLLQKILTATMMLENSFGIVNVLSQYRPPESRMYYTLLGVGDVKIRFCSSEINEIKKGYPYNHIKSYRSPYA